MKHAVLIGTIFLGWSLFLLKAGSVIPLGNTSEMTGKLSLTSSSVHVEGNPSSDVNLPDILVANFGETPFQLNPYFSSDDKGGKIPPGWTSVTMGTVASPGSSDVTGGTYSLKGPGQPAEKKPPTTADNLFFTGCPWPGNGQWTVHLIKGNPNTLETPYIGLMVRDTLDAGAPMFAMADGTLNPAILFRTAIGRPAGAMPVPMDIPIWMRLTRYGASIFASTSSDGDQWDLVTQSIFKPAENPMVGLFVSAIHSPAIGEATFADVSFTPVPSTAQVFPPGVLLQSGSYLAGTFSRLTTDPSNPDVEGVFLRMGQNIAIARSKIATVLLLPTTRQQIEDMKSPVGILMQNGDLMDGEFDSIGGSNVQVNSVLLGITTYSQFQVRACFLHAMQPPNAPYQFRLHDGSIVNATNFTVNEDHVLIQEASGLSITAPKNDVAQFRAGPSVAQSMAELDWKATPSAAAAPAPAAASANAAPAPNTIPSNIRPLVQSWSGPNQEQVLQTSTGTSIDFPLTGKFRAMGVKVALSTDSPPNAQLTIRVLADGREIGRSPPFKAGDQPRFLQLTLQHPKTLTLEAESIFAGVQVLFIDPVAIRDN